MLCKSISTKFETPSFLTTKILILFDNSTKLQIKEWVSNERMTDKFTVNEDERDKNN